MKIIIQLTDKESYTFDNDEGHVNEGEQGVEIHFKISNGERRVMFVPYHRVLSITKIYNDNEE